MWWSSGQRLLLRRSEFSPPPEASIFSIKFSAKFLFSRMKINKKRPGLAHCFNWHYFFTDEPNNI